MPGCGAKEKTTPYEIHVGESFSTFLRWEIGETLVDLTGFTTKIVFAKNSNTQIHEEPLTIGSDTVDSIEYHLSVDAVLPLPAGKYKLQLIITEPVNLVNDIFDLPDLIIHPVIQ